MRTRPERRDRLGGDPRREAPFPPPPLPPATPNPSTTFRCGITRGGKGGGGHRAGSLFCLFFSRGVPVWKTGPPYPPLPSPLCGPPSRALGACSPHGPTLRGPDDLPGRGDGSAVAGSPPTVVRALTTIRDGRLYRASHGTFEEYCKSRWGFTDRRARMLMSASEVVGNLETGTTVPLPASERQARPLAALPPEERARTASPVESLGTATGGEPVFICTEQAFPCVQNAARFPRFSTFETRPSFPVFRRF